MDTTFSPSRLSSAATGAALALSAVALADAVHRGAGTAPVWDQEVGSPAAVAAALLVHAAGYLVLAAALVGVGQNLDGGRRVVRLLRSLIVAALTVLGVAFVGLTLSPLTGSPAPDALGAVSGVAFGLVLLLPVVLGAVLVRPRRTRTPAALLIAAVPVLALTMVLAAVAPDWAHPAYVEAVVYTGLALLVTRATRRAPAPLDPVPARAHLAGP